MRRSRWPGSVQPSRLQLTSRRSLRELYGRSVRALALTFLLQKPQACLGTQQFFCARNPPTVLKRDQPFLHPATASMYNSAPRDFDLLAVWRPAFNRRPVRHSDDFRMLIATTHCKENLL
jgi:hypothetical protein